MTAVPTWSELKALMSDGPDLAVRGTIRDVDGGEERYVGWVAEEDDPRPLLAHRVDTDVVAWRAGDRLRLEDPAGRTTLVSDGRTTWVFVDPGTDTPHERPPGHVILEVGGTALLERPHEDRWRGDDFTRPTGPVGSTTFLGRAAWTVELAPPAHKQHPVQLVVDAETGLLLQQRNDGFGMVTEWVELVVGEHLDPALFTWSGPVVTWEEQRAERRREHAARDRERTDWVREHVGPTSLTFSVQQELQVHEWDDDGSFYGGLDSVGTLQRRPRSDEPWERLSDGAHRWSDDRWDWSFETWGELVLADGALAALEQQLSGGAG